MTNLIISPENNNLAFDQEKELHECVKLKPKYYVERAEVIGDVVEVDYCMEHDLNSGDPVWFEDSISLPNIKRFIDENDLRKDYIDGCDHEGNHAQTVIGVSMEEFLKSGWELEQACKRYLEAGKERIKC